MDALGGHIEINVVFDDDVVPYLAWSRRTEARYLPLTFSAGSMKLTAKVHHEDDLLRHLRPLLSGSHDEVRERMDAYLAAEQVAALG